VPPSFRGIDCSVLAAASLNYPTIMLPTLSPKDAGGPELAALCHQVVSAASGRAWFIDVDANTAMANEHMAELLRATVDEMLGRPLTDFMSTPQRERTLVYLSKRQRRIAEQHDFEFEGSDGRAIWLSLATLPILDAQGE
jgi:PAS domain S-box-containing protein